MVRANLLAADSDVTGAVNIGHGRETSVLQLLQALNDLTTGRVLPDPREPERSGDVRRSCLDVTRARRDLAWQATVPLREGLQTILAGL